MGTNTTMLIDVATGRKEADLVLKNGYILDVFNHSIIKADVAIINGIIAGIGEYSGIKEIDIEDQYVIPGLIDSHVHIESSMLTPKEYARLAVLKGVTTLIADPHEIVNVCGEAGLKFMIDDIDDVPIDIHYMLPSCVPATPFDNSGAVIDSQKTHQLLEKYKLLGLGEMMNYVGVINSDSEVLAKLEGVELIDGHAPLVTDKNLCGYICAGIRNDHECSTADDALEKISKGMKILIREGTAARNLEALIKAVTPYNYQNFSFCSDDKDLMQIMTEGTISHCIKKAISLGLNPITANIIASHNPAIIHKLKNKGAIAPGYIADLVITDNLNHDNVSYVLKNGTIIVEHGYAVYSKGESNISTVTDTVNIKKVTDKDLEVIFDPKRPVIAVEDGSLITNAEYVESDNNLSMCANIERYKASGNIGKCFIKGLTINNGAVAQTIGHDCHNITVIGDNSRDMATAVNALGTKGGIVVVKNNHIIAKMILPVAGLMTNKPCIEAQQEHSMVMDAIKEISPDSCHTLTMLLSFISLLVIPHIKLGDRGIFDVDKFKYI